MSRRASDDYLPYQTLPSLRLLSSRTQSVAGEAAALWPWVLRETPEPMGLAPPPTVLYAARRGVGFSG